MTMVITLSMMMITIAITKVNNASVNDNDNHNANDGDNDYDYEYDNNYDNVNDNECVSDNCDGHHGHQANDTTDEENLKVQYLASLTCPILLILSPVETGPNFN